jgi:hypothetical protein
MSASSDTREPGKERNSDSVQTLLLYRLGRSSAWMAFFTLVIAAAAGAAGWLFWNQLGIMQDQLDTLQDLSEKIQKTFDSSRTQSEALTSMVQTLSARASGTDSGADRPWVGVDSVSVSPLRPYEKLSVTAMVRNTGRSPALNVAIVLSTSKAAGVAGSRPEFKECSGCPESALLPNSALTIDASINDAALTPGTINRLTTGEETIVLNGRIDYKDMAGQAHRTLVCLSYRPKTSAFSTCPTGNYFD